jgi:hypothetical protein
MDMRKIVHRLDGGSNIPRIMITWRYP